MLILFAADHAGFELKNTLVSYVRELGYQVEDLGADALDEKDDYPEIMARAARRVSEDPDNTKAIILGASGQGEAIVANRFPNVRATVFYGPLKDKTATERQYGDILRLGRQDNNANVLSLAGRFLNTEDAKAATVLWLETPFSNEERHARRVTQIEQVSSL